jgi:hypothetical protein
VHPTGKSSFMCDSCKQPTGETTNVQFLASCSHKKTLSTETQCSASPLGDLDCVSALLEVVRVNGISTMEIVKFLVDMVSTLVSVVQKLKTDNYALKTQLRDLQQGLQCDVRLLHLFHLPQRVRL